MAVCGKKKGRFLLPKTHVVKLKTPLLKASVKSAETKKIELHIAKLSACTTCKEMHRPVVTGLPVASKILFVGQAPGDKEGIYGRPFAWTAGKTLFKWFHSIGMTEEHFRTHIYMAAVCRCFPGKNPKGGDRVPNDYEIASCARWLEKEFSLLEPELILPVGKLAISQFLEVERLNNVIGRSFKLKLYGKTRDVIPLPHPSGASTWHRMEPGKSLLQEALKLIETHPSYRQVQGLKRATS